MNSLWQGYYLDASVFAAQTLDEQVLTALSFGSYNPAVSTGASELTTISSWGREGLQSGDWVMKGPANKWNYFWSGKYQPSWMPGGNIPAPFSAGQEFTVPVSTLAQPPGAIGAIKEALGQKIYTGPIQ